MRPIEDTVVLVTGATDGLGRAVARELFARGARVLVHGRDRTKLYPAARELSRGGVPAPAFLADLSSLEEVRDLAALRPAHDACSSTSSSTTPASARACPRAVSGR